MLLGPGILVLGNAISSMPEIVEILRIFAARVMKRPRTSVEENVQTVQVLDSLPAPLWLSAGVAGMKCAWVQYLEDLVKEL